MNCGKLINPLDRIQERSNMPEENDFRMDWKLIDQIKKWVQHYEKLGLTQNKINGLIERRKGNHKIYSNPKPVVNT